MMISELVAILLFGYPLPPEMIDPRFPEILQRPAGLLLTLLITVTSLIIGALLGTVLAFCRREVPEDPQADIVERWLDRAIRVAAATIVEGVRGLPIMLLVLLVFHLPFRLLGLRFPSFLLAVTAFSLYAGAYFSESMRAGLRSVDSGMQQVGKVLGLTPRQILLKIELPLIYRTMKPDVINLTVTVFKDTSTLAVVAVPEVTYVGRQLFMAEPVNYALVLIIILISYWLPATIVSALAARAEQQRASLAM
jgi:His/Glu/Gln/Arg/opine family amino acid ABC transporter permease subunit